MATDNNNQEKFDLELRSILEDAELKAPRGVWNAIASSLDAKASAASGWWKWAGLSLAAAALAAGVFFAATTGTKQETVSVDAVAEVAPVKTVEKPAIQQNSEIQPKIKKTIQSAVVVCPEEQPTTVSIPVAEVAETPESANEPETAAGTKVAEEKPQSDVARIWERITAEEAAETAAATSRRGARQLYAQGLVGSNEGNFAKSAWMSPGTASVAQTGLTETSESSYSIPFTVGVGARWFLTDRFAVGTGVDYSLLSRKFTGTYRTDDSILSGDVRHNIQYLGVPVNLYYTITGHNSRIFNVYAHAGAELEFCVSNKYNFTGASTGTVSEPCSKPQASVGAGLGIELKVTDFLGIYVDPGYRYYIPGDQPKSLRTEKPGLMTFNAGLRFDL